MTPDQMQMLRRHRVECILLGMVLAKDGDREKILAALSPASVVHGELIRSAMSGVANSEPEPVLKAFKQWGVDIEGTVADSLVSRVKEYSQIDSAREALRAATETTDPAKLKAILSEALSKSES